MKKLSAILCSAVLLLCIPVLLSAQPVEWKYETIDRGVVALPAKSGSGNFISWRLLASDNSAVSFDVLRDGQPIATDLRRVTNYTDAAGTATSQYQVRVNNNPEEETTPVVTPWTEVYKTLRMDRPEKKWRNDKKAYEYWTPQDLSVGDVDGDGEYELIMKWQPTDAQDNSQGGYTSNVYLDCYKLSGEKLWRIDLGPNIRAGEHYTQFLVYDFDGDGKAELMCKTAPATKDGAGNYVSQVATDEEIRNNTDETASYRIYKSGKRINGKPIYGPEFLTVFNGETGRAIHTVWYNPNRMGGFNSRADFSEENDYGSAVWGDNIANRCDRFLACVAHLDGLDANASAVFTRGYYTRAYLWTVDFDGTTLSTRWLHASTSETEVTLYGSDLTAEGTTTTYDTHTSTRGLTGNTCYGQGAHNIAVGDVDGDGKDEIMFGAAAVDHDGSLLYSTGLGHGDATHLGDFMPDRPGLEFFMVQEEAPYGWHLRDAATGEILLDDSGSSDTGMGTIADFDPNYRGAEFWSSDKDYLYNVSGDIIADVSEETVNAKYPHKFRTYWDGDTTELLFYKTSIQRFANGKRSNIIDFSRYGNSTFAADAPARPCLQADILGDWREEMVFYDSTDSCTLNIFTTNIPSDFRFTTLMHDHVYRMGIAWQNVSYNMPPHLGYYLPDAVQPEEEELTGIETLRNGENETLRNGENGQMRNGVYDLYGRKVADHSSSLMLHSSLKPGLYIVDGRKVVK